MKLWCKADAGYITKPKQALVTKRWGFFHGTIVTVGEQLAVMLQLQTFSDF